MGMAVKQEPSLYHTGWVDAGVEFWHRLEMESEHEDVGELIEELR